MKKTKKALASLAIAGMTLSMIPFNVFAASPVTRIAGVTAEQTAVQIAEKTGYTGTAVLASSTSYGMVDALTAGPLAASLKAPILLTGAGNTLDAATKAELTKLAVKKVYVTSGTAVIKQGVIDELKAMGIEVVALGGFDRAATSVNIAKQMTGVTKVAIANTVPDALSIASVASAANQAILLTDKDALPASVADYLKSAGITASDVIGGSGVISDAVVAGLPGATRHYGMTAYDTNNQVIQDFAAGLEFDNVYVANGQTGIDALAGAPLAAQTKSAIVLTDGKSVPAAAAFTYGKNASAVVTALGGEAVVPEAVRAGVAAGQVTPVGGLEIVSVSALDDTNKYLSIQFSASVYGIDASDVTIVDAKKGDRFGVKEVTLSKDGKSATIELFENTEFNMVLQENTEYTVTVNANGTIVKGVFYDSAFTESRVVDINVADREFTAYDEKTNAPKVIKVPKGVEFDYEAALGEVVRVWYNDDNQLVKAEIQNKSAVYGGVKIDDKDTIILLSTGKKYDLSTEVYTNTSVEKSKFYFNGNEESAFVSNGDFDSTYVGKKYNYAKVGFNDSGDIEYISAYNLSNFLIVDEVDGDEVVGIEGQTGGSFDAEDATIVKDGKVIALSDLKKGDVLFFNNNADGGDGFALVYNKTVTGEIDTVYSTSINVGGKAYSYIYDPLVTAPFMLDYAKAVYMDDDELVQMDSDAAEELQAGGDVTLYLDPAGNLVYVSGDTAAVNSNEVSAILTDAIAYDTVFLKDKIQVEALLEDGEELIQELMVKDLDTITINGKSYDIDNEDTDVNDNDYVVDVDDAGVIIIKQNVGGTPIDYGTAIDLDDTEGQLVTLGLDDDGNVEEIQFFNDANTDEGVVISTDVLEAGDSYFKAAVGGSKKLLSKTVVFDATDDNTGFDADDITVTTWGEYKGSDISVGAVAVYNEDNEVVALTILNTTSSDKLYNEAVLTRVLKNTDLEIVSIDAFVDGKKVTLEVDKVKDTVSKGDVVVLGFDDNNTAVVNEIFTKDEIAAQGTAEIIAEFDADYIATDLVVDVTYNENGFVNGVNVGERKVKFVTAGIYTLVSDGKVIDATDVTDITIEYLSDLRDASLKVTVIKDEKDGMFAKYFVIK